jgi:hypothetical protein
MSGTTQRKEQKQHPLDFSDIDVIRRISERIKRGVIVDEKYRDAFLHHCVIVATGLKEERAPVVANCQRIMSDLIRHDMSLAVELERVKLDHEKEARVAAELHHHQHVHIESASAKEQTLQQLSEVRDLIMEDDALASLRQQIAESSEDVGEDEPGDAGPVHDAGNDDV